MNPIRLYFIDDHQMFRDGLHVLFEAAPDINVVGEADSAETGLQQVAQLQPDVVLMDIQMPGLNGIEATQHLKAKHPDIAVLMLTMFEDDQSVFAAMCAGASGYVLKGLKHQEMISAIRTASTGGAVFSRDIANRMVSYFQTIQPQVSAGDTYDLSTREQEVLMLIAEGYDNQQIADHLFIAQKTVRNYVSQIMKKLSVSSRKEAALKAQQAKR